jgi:hypothetical protein
LLAASASKLAPVTSVAHCPVDAMYAPIMPPDPESAKAAVETLRHELDMTVTGMESTDRKAALVPAALGAVAGILIAPGSPASPLAGSFLVAALAAGIVAGYYTLRVLRAERYYLGPDAKTTADNVHLDSAHFDWAVATALGKAIEANQKVEDAKGRRLNLALFAASIAILGLAAARIAG